MKMAFFFMLGSIDLSFDFQNFQNFYSNQLTAEEVDKIIIDFKSDGIDAFGKLKADFAIIFSLNEQLYLARDSFGNIPLFYFIIGTKIYFSINIKNLIERSEYEKEINLTEVNYFFNHSSSIYGYNNQTLWKGIYSVLPGQLLIFDKDFKQSTNNFFKLTSKKYNNDSLLEEFKAIFKNTIAENIKYNENVSSSLSGGIDSSSISSMLQNVSNSKINTIELRTPFEIGKERPFAQDVVDHWNTNHVILSKYPNFFGSEKRNCEDSGLPSYSLLTAGRQLAIINTLNTLNSKKFFMGEGGDQVLGLQKEYLDELVEKSAFSELKIALFNVLQLKTKSKSSLHKIPYGKHFLQSTLKDLVENKKYFDSLKFVYKFYTPKLFYNYLIKFLRKSIKNSSQLNLNSLLKIKDFSHDTTFQNHLKQIKNDNRKNFSYLSNIFSRESIKIKEQYFFSGQTNGIEFIYPFYNLDIMNFISNADKKLNFGNGIGRNIIRQSLKGVLPDSIVNRNSKTYFSPFLHQVFWDLNAETKLIFTKNHKIWDYIDFETFKEIENVVINTDYYDHLSFGIKNTYLITTLKVYYFGIWLDTYFK